MSSTCSTAMSLRRVAADDRRPRGRARAWDRDFDLARAVDDVGVGDDVAVVEHDAVTGAAGLGFERPRRKLTVVSIETTESARPSTISATLNSLAVASTPTLSIATASDPVRCHRRDERGSDRAGAHRQRGHAEHGGTGADPASAGPAGRRLRRRLGGWGGSGGSEQGWARRRPNVAVAGIAGGPVGGVLGGGIGVRGEIHQSTLRPVVVNMTRTE